MSGIYKEFETHDVRLILNDGRIINGHAILCLSADEDSDGVEYDSIQLRTPDGDMPIYFSDEIRSVEITD